MTHSKEHSARGKSGNETDSKWKPKIRTCKGCKVRFQQVRANQIVCRYSCGITYAKTLEAKKKKQKEIIERKRIREEKEKIKTLSQYKNDLQRLVNEIARLLDKDLPCIATGNYNGKMSGGHYFSVGSNPSLRFHLDNIHKQCYYSNGQKGGQPIEYREGLEQRYGEDFVSSLHNLREQYPTLKGSKTDVKVWIGRARKIRDKLKNGVEMTRDQVNNELGIYT